MCVIIAAAVAALIEIQMQEVGKPPHGDTAKVPLEFTRVKSETSASALADELATKLNLEKPRLGDKTVQNISGVERNHVVRDSSSGQFSSDTFCQSCRTIIPDVPVKGETHYACRPCDLCKTKVLLRVDIRLPYALKDGWGERKKEAIRKRPVYDELGDDDLRPEESDYLFVPWTCKCYQKSQLSADQIKRMVVDGIRLVLTKSPLSADEIQFFFKEMAEYIDYEKVTDLVEAELQVRKMQGAYIEGMPKPRELSLFLAAATDTQMRPKRGRCRTSGGDGPAEVSTESTPTTFIVE